MEAPRETKREASCTEDPGGNLSHQRPRPSHAPHGGPVPAPDFTTIAVEPISSAGQLHPVTADFDSRCPNHSIAFGGTRWPRRRHGKENQPAQPGATPVRRHIAAKSQLPQRSGRPNPVRPTPAQPDRPFQRFWRDRTTDRGQRNRGLDRSNVPDFLFRPAGRVPTRRLRNSCGNPKSVRIGGTSRQEDVLPDRRTLEPLPNSRHMVLLAQPRTGSE